MKRVVAALILAFLLLLVVDGRVSAQQGCAQQFAFVGDATIPDDSPMQPGQQFAKAWRLTNNGTCDWTATYSIAYVGGTPLSGSSSVPLGGPVLVGQTADLYVPMIAPTKPGMYTSLWELRDESAKRVGLLTLYVRIIVPGSESPTKTPVKATATVPSSEPAYTEPTDTPTGTDRFRDATSWEGVYIGMPADDVLVIHPKITMSGPSEVLGADSEGLVVTWPYPGADLIFSRWEQDGIYCYRVTKIQVR